MAKPHAEPAPDLAGKTALVTGATNGIGEVTAIELARMGASVLVVGRDPQRTDATLARIKDQAGRPAAEAFLADLSMQAEVRRLAEQVRARYPKLDILVNNAGALFAKRGETPDGIERTFALNHLGYFLLTNLLLDPLKAAGRARVVNVASMAHQMARGGIHFDDIQFKQGYAGMKAYSQSKLANILFSNELARRLEGTGVTSNAVHPGIVASNFTAGNGATGWLFRRLYSVIAISNESGAKTQIHLAASPAVEGITGRYFADSKPAMPAPQGRDSAAARRLWEVSEAMTGGAAAV